MARFLTKSLFIRAMECPRKLYYAKKRQYADNSLDNDFLEALAEGGIQVGALARCYFPDGILVDEIRHEAALTRTNELLKREKVIIFEAAVQSGNCFIRADILIKDGACLDLIEVKAKSCKPDELNGFMKKRGKGISSDWSPYIYDVAFQKLVLQRAFPKAIIRSYLMLADKESKASVDGLNQRFVLQEENGRLMVCTGDHCSPVELGDRVLVQVPVDEAVRFVSTGKHEATAGRTLEDYVDWLAYNYVKDIKIDWPVGIYCQSCEFRAGPGQISGGLKCGFCECWEEKKGYSYDDLQRPCIFDIWNFRGKDSLLGQGRFFMTDVKRDDIIDEKRVSKHDKPGLHPCLRQWMQVEKAQHNDPDVCFDGEGFSQEMKKWRYPLHFIDFETSSVAIPFNKGRRPYEGIAFQFSHHKINEDGTVEHAGEYLNTVPGAFPNYDFVRALKQELENDEGTIFRYAAHENTYLKFIVRQLQEDDPVIVKDRDELVEWIKTITQSSGGNDGQWEGERNMVDMCELVKRYYYNPRTNGSNSIKYVLPAVLNSSKVLQDKYSSPIYGAQGGIRSINYRDWAWINYDESSRVIDPYHLLPPVEKGVSPERFSHAERTLANLADGAAAMTAYARLQFMHLPAEERRNIEDALLRYCELDTMAMVMIWEHWMDLLQKV